MRLVGGAGGEVGVVDLMHFIERMKPEDGLVRQGVERVPEKDVAAGFHEEVVAVVDGCVAGEHPVVPDAWVAEVVVDDGVDDPVEGVGQMDKTRFGGSLQAGVAAGHVSIQ